MIPIDIPEARQTLYLPENLGECDARQYADMAKLLFWFRNGEISYADFRVLAVYSLLNLKRTDKKTKEGENDKYEAAFLLSEIVENFFEKTETPEGLKLEVKNYFTNNHFPVYRYLGFRKFYGPQDGFADVTFGQYVDGLEEFIYFHESGDLEALRMLFAIFYLRKGEEYNYGKAKRLANSVFSNVDIRHLYGFFIYFSAMQNYILSGELTVMGNVIDLALIYEDPERKSGKKSDIPGIGMRGVVNDIAKSQVFGPVDSVRRTNMWEILIHLYELKKKYLDELKNSKNEPAKV